MTLPLEAKKWLLNKRKHQQQEDDKTKKHLALNNEDATKIPDKDSSNSNIPNQYARVQNTVRREEVVQEDSDQTYSFVDELLEEAVRSSSIYEAGQEIEDDFWTAEHKYTCKYQCKQYLT
jgi:hypothetical protein